jgi:hypothetical protein
MSIKNIVFMPVILAFVSGYAQFTDSGLHPLPSAGAGGKPAARLIGLLDPSRFEMTHRYSMSFFSGGGGMVNQGLYLNTMRYRFTDSLFAQVQIGFLHRPFGDAGNSGGSAGALFLRSATLLYKPTDKIHLRFEVESGPAFRRGWTPADELWW